jgi:hypothetical protein
MVLGFIIKDCGGASSAPTAHRVAKTASDAMLSLPQRLPQLAAVMGCWVCMHTRRTTRRAQVLEAHVVVIGALLSALARLIHRRCRQMQCDLRLALLASAVCLRAHTIAHTTAHTGTCSGAQTCARLSMLVSRSTTCIRKQTASHTQTR